MVCILFYFLFFFLFFFFIRGFVSDSSVHFSSEHDMGFENKWPHLFFALVVDFHAWPLPQWGPSYSSSLIFIYLKIGSKCL